MRRNNTLTIDQRLPKSTAKTVVSEKAFRALEQGEALVQVLSFNLINKSAISKLINQLQHPGEIRPIRDLEDNIDRTRVYNPRLGRWYSREITGERGRTKLTNYTKKKSLTLLPTDGVMHLYKPFNGGNTVNILYDSQLCNLKDEKYIFANDQATNSKFWLKVKDFNEAEYKLPRALSLSELAEQIKRQRIEGIVPEYNDVSACVSREAIIRLIVTDNTFFNRLNTLSIRNLFFRHLQLDLPVLIIDKNLNKTLAYDKLYQDADLRKASTYPLNTPVRILLQREFPPTYIITSSKRLNQLVDPLTIAEVLPLELIHIVLSYLSLSEIIKLNLIHTDSLQPNGLEKIIDIVLPQVAQNDFESWVKTLRPEWVDNTIRLLKDATPNDFALKYINDFANVANTQEQLENIERALMHWIYHEKPTLEQLLDQIQTTNPAVYRLAIEKLPREKLVPIKKVIGSQTYSI